MKKKNNNLLSIIFTIVVLLIAGYYVISSNTTSTSNANSNTSEVETVEYTFRNKDLLEEHYKKHGIDMGFSNKEEYQEAACAVINNPNSLHKKEKEDGDDVYYLEDTNEFVILSTDGYIRTYFNPDAGIDYYNRK